MPVTKTFQTMSPEGSPILNKIFIKTKFVGFHRWLDAPPEVKFLREWHRHEFHVTLYKDVNHANRDIEFTSLKKAVDKYIQDTWEDCRFELSCEQMANRLLEEFQACLVSVSEDGENGGTAQIPPLFQIESFPQHSSEEAEEIRQKFKEDFERYSSGLQRYMTIQGVTPNPISLQKRTKIFIGIEAEGPYRGERTLFIPGSVTPERLEKALRMIGTENLRVYFGAGWDNQMFDISTWSMIKETFAPSKITVELDEYNEESSFVQVKQSSVTIVAGIVSSCDLDMVHYIKKITPTHVIWIGEGKKFYMTKLNDPLYSQDKELE